MGELLPRCPRVKGYCLEGDGGAFVCFTVVWFCLVGVLFVLYCFLISFVSFVT